MVEFTDYPEGETVLFEGYEDEIGREWGAILYKSYYGIETSSIALYFNGEEIEEVALFDLIESEEDPTCLEEIALEYIQEQYDSYEEEDIGNMFLY